MNKCTTIYNTNVQVFYQSTPEMLVVQSIRNVIKQQVFAGYDGLNELFESYCESFNEQITYDETCTFFKPNIQSVTVNAPGK